MPKQLRNEFPSEPEVTVITNEDLKILDEQFGDLYEKIKSGEYVVEAKQTGKVEDIETGSSMSRYIDNTTLTVTIKPADNNTAAAIKEMAFTFKNNVIGGSGCFTSYEQGTVKTSFRIEPAVGKPLVYGPESRDCNEYSSGLLMRAKNQGLGKIHAAEAAARNAVWQKQQAEKAAAEAAKTAAIKNIRL